MTCYLGMTCTNGTATPPEGCQCQDKRCPAGDSCLTSSDSSPSQCISPCPVSSSPVLLASTECGCNKTLCTVGETCDPASSQCFKPCDNPSLQTVNNLQTLKDQKIHLLGQHVFSCTALHYVKIKGVRSGYFCSSP